MSSTSDTLPMPPARFAAVLKNLSLSMLHLKVLELRNSIAHLDYSNEQLRPFAEGTEAALSSSDGTPEPDQECIDAMAENEVVIARMQERIGLVKAEVEERGFSWTEFQTREEVEEDERRRGEGLEGLGNGQARTDGESTQHEAWRDGTFQTGTIRHGEVRLDPAPGSSGGTNGGSLTDEELRVRLEEQMGSLDDADEGGMHL